MFHSSIFSLLHSLHLPSFRSPFPPLVYVVRRTLRALFCHPTSCCCLNNRPRAQLQLYPPQHLPIQVYLTFLSCHPYAKECACMCLMEQSPTLKPSIGEPLVGAHLALRSFRQALWHAGCPMSCLHCVHHPTHLSTHLPLTCCTLSTWNSL